MRAHQGPGGAINPMKDPPMTVTHKGANMLNDAEFDKLIAGKFPPMRRRSEPMDFEPTIAVDRPDPEDVQACSHCKGKCPTPQACGLDSEFGAIEGMVKGAKWILAPWFVMTVIAAVLWAWWFV